MSNYSIKTKICDACGASKPLTSYSVNGRDGYRNRRCKICVYLGVPDKKTKVCPACNVEKPMIDFTTDHKKERVRRCKLCKSRGIKIPPEKKINTKGVKKGPMPRLANVTKEDYKNMYLLFSEVMGYDINSKLSIHEQFCQRHNLTPNNPLNHFKEFISVEECFN